MRLHTCEECGRPFTRKHPRQRRCDEHDLRGRDGASPTTRAQDSEYETERRRVLVPGASCHWCNLPATTVDHLVPVVRGGRHKGNLVPACEPCNFSRQDDPDWRPPNGRHVSRSSRPAPAQQRPPRRAAGTRLT